MLCDYAPSGHHRTLSLLNAPGFSFDFVTHLIRAVFSDRKRLLEQSKQLSVAQPVRVLRTARAVRHANDEAVIPELSVKDLNHVAPDVAIGSLIIKMVV